MTAFCLALYMGADGIETDVRRSADGRLVLFHDATMKRICGLDEPVESLPWDQLLKLDFGGYRGPVFRHEKIVLLEDFLRYFGDKEIVFAIELKGADVEIPTVQMLYQFGVGEKSTVTSFHLEYLRKVRSFDHKIHLGYLTERINDEILSLLERESIGEICPKAEFLAPDAVAKAKEQGFSVRAWGVKTRDLMEKTVLCGVDGMTVNFPDALASFLKTRTL
jgi:glycerophosphoryl diester phosphodiesterase